MTECTAEENPSAAPSAAAGTPPAPAAAPRRHRFSGRWRPLRRRLGFYLVAAWAAITANFLIPRLMPGDPAEVILRQFQKTSGESRCRPGPSTTSGPCSATRRRTCSSSTPTTSATSRI